MSAIKPIAQLGFKTLINLKIALGLFYGTGVESLLLILLKPFAFEERRKEGIHVCPIVEHVYPHHPGIPRQ